MAQPDAGSRPFAGIRSLATGPSQILFSTGIVGVLAIVLTFVVARVLGAADYSGFAVYWSATFLVTGALVGIQQEVARATHPVGSAHAAEDHASLSRFAVAAAAIVAVVVVASSPLWLGPVFPSGDAVIVGSLAFGAAFYVTVAVITGALFGVGIWRYVAQIAVVDAILRFVLVLSVLFLAPTPSAFAVAIAVPFALAPLLLARPLRRALSGRIVLDVRYGRLSLHVLQSLVGSISTAAMVSGFPVFVVASAGSTPTATVGAFILVVTLVRSPLVVVFMAMQSVLIVRFRNDRAASARFAIRLLALVAAATVVLGALAWTVGPDILAWAAGPDYRVAGFVLAALIASSGAMAGLCVTGPFAIARGRHAVYSAGWLLAAAVTICVLFVPLPFETRVTVALLAGPFVGMVAHLLGLVILRPRPRGR